MTIDQIKNKVKVVTEQELEEKGVWFTCKAILTRINRDRQFFWVACPVCQKKVTYPGGNDGFGTGEVEIAFCGNCQKEVEHPVKKYLLTADIADGSGVLTFNAMGDRGIQLMGGISCDELVQTKEMDMDTSLHKRSNDYFFDRESRQYIFKIQAKCERYRDEATIKYRLHALEMISGASPHDDRGALKTAIIRESNSSLEWIYERIPRVTV